MVHPNGFIRAEPRKLSRWDGLRGFCACVRDIELEATRENFRKMEAEEEEKFS